MVELTDQERALLVALIMNSNAPLNEHSQWMALASKLQVSPPVAVTEPAETVVDSAPVTPETPEATPTMENETLTTEQAEAAAAIDAE